MATPASINEGGAGRAALETTLFWKGSQSGQRRVPESHPRARRLGPGAQQTLQPALGEPRGIWLGKSRGDHRAPEAGEPWTCCPTRSVRPGLLPFAHKANERAQFPGTCSLHAQPFAESRSPMPLSPPTVLSPRNWSLADVCSGNSLPPEPAEPEAASLSVGVRRARSLVLPDRGSQVNALDLLDSPPPRPLRPGRAGPGRPGHARCPSAPPGTSLPGTCGATCLLRSGQTSRRSPDHRPGPGAPRWSPFAR